MVSFVDIRTLLFVLSTTTLALGLCMAAYSSTRKTYPGFNSWTRASMLHAAAFFLFSLRGIIPNFLSIIAGNLIFITAMSLFYFGFKLFVGEKPNVRLHTALILSYSLGFIPYFTYINPDPSGRIATACFFAVFYILLSCKSYMQTKKYNIAGNNHPLIVSLVSLIITFAVCGMAYTLSTAQPQSLLSAGVFFEAALIATTMLLILLTVGFMQLNTLKLEQELIEERDHLEKSRTKFESLSEAAFEGIIITENGIIHEANTMACSIFGYDRSDYIGMEAINCVMPGHRDTVRNNIESGFEDHYEVTGQRKDGSKFPLELQCKTFIHEGEETRVTAMRDNTARKQTEKTLHNLNLAVQQSPISIVITSRDGTLEYVNRKFCKLTGYSMGEVLGKNPSFLQSGAVKTETYKDLWKTITAKNEWHGELCNRKKNGELYWESATITPILDGENNITHFLGIKEDITEKRQMAEALRQSETKFRNLVEYSGDFVWEVNTKGVYTYASPLVEKILGYTPEEVLGKTPFELMPQTEAAKVAEEFNQAFEQGKPLVQLENINLHRDGRHITLETSGVPVFDGDGKITHYRGVDRDITMRKQREVEREQLIDGLQKALEEIKTLGGLIPICSSCKKIRDDQGYWNILESYIQKHTNALFSHSMCPDCSDTLYGKEDWYQKMKEKNRQRTPDSAG
ncbi:MAG: PAS domain-containing protein [Thermodesulfobacteriota bacterium]